jgi:hypothetical protein
MSLDAVSREAGPDWIDGKGAFDQTEAMDHAAVMNDLSEQGFVPFAGPWRGQSPSGSEFC